jgi:hypothetical protein
MRGKGLGVVGLAPQIDLAPRVLHELGDDSPRLVARQDRLESRAQDLEQHRVARQRLADAGLDDLDDHRLAFDRGGAMDLRDGRRAGRLRVDPGVHLGDRPPGVLDDQSKVTGQGDHRQAVEKILELLGDRLRQEILAQCQHLAELDVGRSQQLQAPAELHREGLVDQRPVDERPRDPGDDGGQPID